jgi:hypothetical protein
MGTGQPPWQLLSGLPAWQVTELPRDGEDSTVRRAQELVSAYCSGTAIAVGWIREHASGPVRVIAAGHDLAAGDVLMLPAGARGIPLPGEGTTRLLAQIPCWMTLAGVCDVLLADTSTPGLSLTTRGGGHPSLENGLLSAWQGSFAWLLIAETVGDATLREMTARAAHEQLGARGFDSPNAKLAERRWSARHAELRQAASTGLWSVHLLAGGATAAQAAQVAGLLRASADLTGLPYALLPGGAAAPPPRPATAPRRPSMADDPSIAWAITAERERSAARNRSDVASSGQQPAPQWRPSWGPSSHEPGAVGWRSPAPANDTWGTAPVQAPEERWPDPQPSAPFYASTALVAALARMPIREVPGLRMVLRPAFDLTPETPPILDGGHQVRLGDVLDAARVPCGDLTIPQASLNRHTFVTGATGAGKSQTIRGLLEQATEAGIPWLVIEPAKAEYRFMGARLPGVRVIRIRPGDLNEPPAGINPLEPAVGPDGTRFPLQTHADLLRALFLAAFQADEPFPQVLAAAITRAYENAGWDMVTGQPVCGTDRLAYPGLEDLQDCALTVVDEIGYGREVRDNVRGFVTVRIGSLRLGTTGRFLDGGHPLDFARLLDANVVFEIEDAGDDRDKAFLMGAVLIRLTEYLRLRHASQPPGPGRLRHLTVIEEAHRLLRQPATGAVAGPAAQSVEMFADLLAEVRAYGEGLVIAEQIPSKLITDVVKNTAVKVVHRLPAADDRGVVGATMNLTSDQSAYLVTLTPGDAAVFTDGMDYPILVRMPDGTARETAVQVITASCETVVGRRSTTCGSDCQVQPCTLAQMRAAQRATITDPRLTLWAELSVLAHLTGWTMPVPRAALTRDLRRMQSRLLDCALSQAVDAAVAARASALSGGASSVVMADHVVDAMRHAIADGTWVCEPDEPRWLAPAYKWAVVRDALAAACRGDGGHAGRHSRSRQWEHDYGQPIPGRDCAAQLAAVTGWIARDQRDPAVVAAVIWGIRPRTAIERAVGARVSDPGWEPQLTGMLGSFRNLKWPLQYLRHAGDQP